MNRTIVSIFARMEYSCNSLRCLVPLAVTASGNIAILLPESVTDLTSRKVFLQFTETPKSNLDPLYGISRLSTSIFFRSGIKQFFNRNSAIPLVLNVFNPIR